MPQLIVQLATRYKVPTVYMHGTQGVIQEALTLGAKVQELVQLERESQELKEALETRDVQHTDALNILETQLHQTQTALAITQSEFTSMKQTHQQKSRDMELLLEQKLRECQDTERNHKVTMLQVERDARKQEREMTLLEYETRLHKLQTLADTAEERKASLESVRERDIVTAEERVRSMMSEIVRIREDQLKTADGTLKSLQEGYYRQTEELKSLNDFLRRKITNVKTKGNQYETHFRELLLRVFQIVDGFALEDTNRNAVGHAGDFLMRLGTERILWEVKDYDKPVPKHEADKFQRDMLEHKDIRVGVMVSRTTELVSKTVQGDRYIEFVEGKLLIFLSRFEFLGDEVTTLQSLIPLFRLWWSVRDDEEKTEHVEETIRELEKLTADLGRRKTEWRVHRNRMEETLRWMTETVEEAEERVETLLKRIQSGVAPDTLEIPEGLFRSEHLDEKIRKTIGWILEDYEPAPHGEARLLDMCDVLAARRKISKDWARKYILAALLDSAVQSISGKATVVRGLARK